MLERMREYFDFQAKLREQALDASRATIRASARSISAIHRGDHDEAAAFLAEAKDGLNALTMVVKNGPSMADSGIVLSAQQEYGEAELVRAAIRDGKLLDVEEIGITYKAYLAAMADAAAPELQFLLIDEP